MKRWNGHDFRRELTFLVQKVNQRVVKYLHAYQVLKIEWMNGYVIIFCTTGVNRYEIIIAPQCYKALNDFVDFFSTALFKQKYTKAWFRPKILDPGHLKKLKRKLYTELSLQYKK